MSNPVAVAGWMPAVALVHWRVLAERGFEVLGLDASANMIERARQLTQPDSKTLAFDVIQTVERLPLEDASFRGIVCSSVIEYVDDPAACLQEFWRILQPGGKLLVSVPNRKSLFRMLERLRFRISGSMSREPKPRYLTFSKHHYFPQDFIALLGQQRFHQLRHVFFGALDRTPISRWARVGSLMFVLAEKVADPV